jgi:hypothetical protein
MTTSNQSDLDEAGRQIHLVPLAPGMWTVILGCGVMVLGPLFGFLFGSMLGSDQLVWGMNAIYACLFFGFLVAGVGLFAALLGVRRILLDNRARRQAR